MEKTIKISLAFLLFLCLADMPEGYYQMIRYAGLVGFGILAFSEKKNGNNGRMFFYVASATLMSPIFKVALGSEFWNILNLVWGVILLGSFFSSNSKKE